MDIQVVKNFFFSFLPESVRWLWANNRQDKVEKRFRKIARINAKTFPESFELEFSADESENGNILKLFATGSMTVHVLICMLAW